MIIRHGIYASQGDAVAPIILIPGDGTTNWTQQSNMTNSLGEALPTTTSIGWGKTSMVDYALTGDFDLEFDLKYMSGQSSNGFVMVGLWSSLTAGWNNFSHGFYFNAGSTASFINNQSTYNTSPSTTFLITDTFNIKRVGTTITYYKNGVSVEVSPLSSSGTVYITIDCNRFLGVTSTQITI